MNKIDYINISGLSAFFRKYKIQLIIFILALMFRLVFLRDMLELDWFYKTLLSDSYVYMKNALSILNGSFLGKRVFYQDPIYPIFLAFVFIFNKACLMDISLIQIFLSSTGCSIISFLGERVWDRRVGVIAGLIAVVYPVWIFYDVLILKTSLSIFFVCLYLLAILRLYTSRNNVFSVVASFVLSILCLLRGNFIFWVPLHFLWLVYQKSSKKNFFISLIVFFLPILPITYFNYKASGNFVLITSQGGQNFYTGNNPYNVSGYYKPLPFVRPSALFEENDFKVYAENESGKKLGASEVSRFWLLRSMNFLKNDTKTFLLNLFKKTAVYFDWYEVPDNYHYGAISKLSYLHYLSFISFSLLWGLCFFAFLQKQTSLKVYFIMLNIGYSFSVIIFFVFSRYRMPIISLLIIFAAAGIVQIYDFYKKGKYRKLVLSLIFVVLTVCIFSWNPFRLRTDPKMMFEIIEKRNKDN